MIRNETATFPTAIPLRPLEPALRALVRHALVPAPRTAPDHGLAAARAEEPGRPDALKDDPARVAAALDTEHEGGSKSRFVYQGMASDDPGAAQGVRIRGKRGRASLGRQSLTRTSQ